MIDRDLGLGLGRDRLFGGFSVSAEIANFSAENRDKFRGKKIYTLKTILPTFSNEKVIELYKNLRVVLTKFLIMNIAFLKVANNW